MLKDRYGLAVSTTYATARDAYVQGCDLYLSLYPGALAAFDSAIAWWAAWHRPTWWKACC